MADANPVPLDIPPGVVMTLTELGVRGRWNRTKNVRFINERAEKIGGYVDRCAGETLVGLARGAFGWVSAARQDLVASGTTSKLYSITDTIRDITPLRLSGGPLPADPFAVTISETTVIVHHAGHGVDTGATVIFAAATAGGGITIDGPYLATYIDNDNFSIEHSVAATSTDATTGGAAVTYEYEINPGAATPFYGVGWGAGGWGDETWGTPRSSGVSFAEDMRVWSFDRYGSMLLVGYTNGLVYLWDEPTDADRAEVIANSPICRYVFLTAERFIFALGTSTQMTLNWPDRDDITIWTPSDAVEASERTLQDGSMLMAGCIFNDAINLIWSDTCLYRAQYIPGATFFYDIAPIAMECGLISQDGWESTAIGVVWMGANDFFIYNGTVTTIPNHLDIRDWVFHNLNHDMSGKIWCGYNPKHNEAWWGLCLYGSVEPNYYVSVVLDGFHWSVGPIDRTAMTSQRSAVGDVVMFGTNSKVYTHESGHDADGVALEAYVGHAAFSLTDGDTDVDVMAYQPDLERQSGAMTIELEIVDRPADEIPLETEIEDIAVHQGVVDLYMGGRYVRSLLRSNVLGGDFRLGIGHLELGVAGEE